MRLDTSHMIYFLQKKHKKMGWVMFQKVLRKKFLAVEAISSTARNFFRRTFNLIKLGTDTIHMGQNKFVYFQSILKCFWSHLKMWFCYYNWTKRTKKGWKNWRTFFLRPYFEMRRANYKLSRAQKNGRNFFFF